jgi:hypothetical protein
MSLAFRFTGILIIGLAAIAAVMSIGGGKVQAAGATIDCAIPNNIVCDVYHPDGIANVTVTVDFGDLGLIDVVDKNFNCQTNVTVSWDPIVPNYAFTVTPCQGFDFKDPGSDDDRAMIGTLVILAHSEARTVGYGGPDSLATPGETMEICHVERDGSIKVMKILAVYWPEHEAHGDGVVAFHLPDGGVACLFVD